MSVFEKMTALADAIREKTGGSDALGLDEMAESIGEVYDKGRASFWDDYQQKGGRRDYRYAFASTGWPDEVYDPKYPIDAGTSRYFCDAVFYTNTNITDTKVPIIALGRLANTFYQAQKLRCIRLLSLNGVTDAQGAFKNCYALEEITVEGLIETDWNMAESSLLTDASVQSVIDALKDLTDGTAKTLTFHADVKARMSDDQISQITAKNWTLA